MRWWWFPILLVCWGCSGGNVPGVSFYHWRSGLDLSEPEVALVKGLGCQRLYVRFFDVDRGPEGRGWVPKSRLQVEGALPPGLALVPCVYVTERSLRGVAVQEVEALADSMVGLLDRLLEQFPGVEVPELQLDCDWTPGSRAAYFGLLRVLYSRIGPRGMELSSTVRLHQFRMPDETGVPPVDRGVLMAYNLGDLDDPGELNSILEVADVERYTSGVSGYPLPLDLALPVFQWTVLVRAGRPVRLLNGVGREAWAGDSLVQLEGDGKWVVRESHYFRGRYLYAGDVLRVESVSLESLGAAAGLLRSAVPEGYGRLVFYDLSPQTVDRYALEDFVDLAGLLQ